VVLGGHCIWDDKEMNTPEPTFNTIATLTKEKHPSTLHIIIVSVPFSCTSDNCTGWNVHGFSSFFCFYAALVSPLLLFCLFGLFNYLL